LTIFVQPAKSLAEQKDWMSYMVYRPYMQDPFKSAALLIAKKFNETSMLDFDDLDINRIAVRELWIRAFPNTPFPADAQELIKPYHQDPEIRLYNLVKS
jgi:hypothetical protein